MIPYNFTIDEVLKLPNITIEELKEYVYNLNITSLHQQIKDLKDEVYDLENKNNELQEQIDNLESDY